MDSMGNWLTDGRLHIHAKNYSKRGYSPLHCTWPICLRLKYICLSISPWWHCCSWVLCYETLQMLQLFSGFDSSLSYMDEYWQMRLTWSFPNTALYIIIFTTIHNIYIYIFISGMIIYTHIKKVYTVYIQGHICLRHLYNIGLDGTISIHCLGVVSLLKRFFPPRIAWNSWTRWRAPCHRWHAPKIGHRYWWGQDIRAELVFVSLWDWVQKIEGFGRAL